MTDINKEQHYEVTELKICKVFLDINILKILSFFVTNHCASLVIYLMCL